MARFKESINPEKIAEEGKKDVEEKLSKAEQEELVFYRKIFQRFGEQIVFWGVHLDEPCMIVRRDVKSFYGVLQNVKFEPVEFEILVSDDYVKYDEGKKIREIRLMKIKPNTLMDIEFLKDRSEEEYKT